MPLEIIQPGTFADHHRKPIQYVLPTISPLQLRNGLHYVELDQATVVEFSLPTELVKPVRRLVAYLQVANAEQGKEFALAQQAMMGASDYNFSDHHRQLRDLFAQVTEPIGWNTVNCSRTTSWNLSASGAKSGSWTSRFGSETASSKT